MRKYVNHLIILTIFTTPTILIPCCWAKPKKETLAEEMSQIPVDIERVLHIINSKADVNAEDNEGMTPIMRAVKNDDMRLVETLIDAGAYLYTRNKNKKR